MIGAAVAAVAAGAYSADQKSSAAKRAASDQSDAEGLARDQQKEQFTAMQKLMLPYVEAGTSALKQMAGYSDVGPMALGKQKALAGLSGYGAQQDAIRDIERSPLLQEQMRQGEQGILQNASATGGLRGGNTQAALGQFRPQVLQQAIDRQYANLGGLTNLGAGMSQNLGSMGQAAAAGEAAAGMGLAGSLGESYRRQGDAHAQSALIQGQARGEMATSVSKGIGTVYGGGFGGGF